MPQRLSAGGHRRFHVRQRPAKPHIWLDKYINIRLFFLSVTSAIDVVAEPARRAILDSLMDGPQPVGQLVRATGLSQPNTSRHLRVLREAGLVRRTADGQRRVYALHAPGFEELERWLAPYLRLWHSSLDALEDHLDEKE
jgi:DNA-binding transcriptional ArsR family regulator